MNNEIEDTIDVPRGRSLAKDLEALADAFFEELKSPEEGSYCIGLDAKRPFGNSGCNRIALDILDIIGVDESDVTNSEGNIDETMAKYAHSLLDELAYYVRAKWFERKPKVDKGIH